MTTTEISEGIYRIAMATFGDVEPELLTRIGNDRVTVLPPSAQPDPRQEWGVFRGQGGNLTIQLPFPFRPSSYLTYQGAPEKPKPGERVECHPSLSLRNEWHPALAPDFRYVQLRVPGSMLGIKYSPATIHPPILELGLKNQLEWHFERLRDLDDVEV